MDKPIIFYEVRPQVNRATGTTILVPAIVEREQAVPLDEIIRRAIDRGLIAGVKESGRLVTDSFEDASLDGQSGYVRVATEGGEATFPVTYYAME